MKKVIKKGVILVGISAMLIGLIGCTNNKISNLNNDDENEVSVEATGELPIATIKVKNFGTIKAELYPNKAPNTVNNFISLANSGFYDGLIFHRVIPGFMIQGGCPEGNGMGGPGYSIKGEFSRNGFKNELKHTKGVLSMARTMDPNSAGSQFFIMVEDAPHLDDQYASFGKVIEGMKVVDKIVNAKTDYSDRPYEDQVIKSMTVETFGETYSEPEIIE